MYHKKGFFLFIFLCLTLSSFAQDQAIPFQAEAADSLGSDFEVVTEGEVTFIRPLTDFAGTTNPGSVDKIALYEITFDSPGTYDLYVRVRVGPNGYDDDSFYFGSSFGERPVDVDADWVRMNNLDFGASADNEYIISREENTTGFGVFKWVNVSEEGEGAEGGTLFEVEADSLTKIIMIGSREDGLDIDMLAFGKADLFYTVSNLENGEAGVTEIPDDIEFTLTVELADSIRPATHAASGALYGVTETLPSNIGNQVGELHPRMYVQPARSGSGFQQPIGAALPVAERLASTTADVTVRLADINPNWPYNFVGWDEWETEVTAVINEIAESGLENIYGYEIWNEQHGTWDVEANGGEFFSTLWKPTYDLIRTLAPDAKIIGPSDSYYSAARIEDFLEYCIENDCLPDIMAWHELGGSNNITANINNYRNLERTLRIDPLEISINEYSSDIHEYEGAPGVSVPFIAKFERNMVHSAAISWWFTAYPGRLGSLLTPSNERGGGWYLYKWYGDMSGYMANVIPPSESGDGLDGFANVDSDSMVISAVFGGDFTGIANIVFNDIPENFGDSVDVMIQYVEWEDKDTPVSGPVMISTSTYAATEGSLSLQVEITDPMYGYRAVMTPKGQMVSSETTNEVADGYSLNQNYPNPFNPSTVISFQLPVSDQVTLKVFDMLGREVATLMDRQLSAGEHKVSFNATGLSSGVYFYRISAGQFSQIRRMMLIK